MDALWIIVSVRYSRSSIARNFPSSIVSSSSSHNVFSYSSKIFQNLFFISVVDVIILSCNLTSAQIGRTKIFYLLCNVKGYNSESSIERKPCVIRKRAKFRHLTYLTHTIIYPPTQHSQNGRTFKYLFTCWRSTSGGDMMREVGKVPTLWSCVSISYLALFRGRTKQKQQHRNRKWETLNSK